jgi:hypothetical protein
MRLTPIDPASCLVFEGCSAEIVPTDSLTYQLTTMRIDTNVIEYAKLQILNPRADSGVCRI